MESELYNESISPKKLVILEKMLNHLMPKIYPVIRYIKIDGPEKKNLGWVTYLIYDINIYTTIPEGITKDNYWTSEYRNMDFSWMGHYHVDELLTYITVKPSEFYRDVYVYNVNDKLIGQF